MADQLTVRLPSELSRALAAAAVDMERKRSEIVRLALRQFLDLTPGSAKTPAAKVKNLIGSLESGVPDLAERHRAYVLESLKNGG